MNRDEMIILRRALLKLARLYRRSVEEDIIQLYIKSLCDLPLREVIKSMKQLIKSKTFFPSIAEIRELCPKYRPIEIVRNESRDFEIPKKFAGEILEFLKGK